jgi:hypothetical protein
MKPLTLILATTVVLTACAHRERTHTVVVERPQTAEFTPAPLDAIRHPAVYKAYHVGRWIDPHQANLMHEGGRVYERVAPDSWNLRPFPPAPVPQGPTVGPTNAAYAPQPGPDELWRELHAQRQVTRFLQEQATRLGLAATNVLAVTQAVAQRQREVEQDLHAQDQRLHRLEESVRLTNAPPSK